MNIQTTIKPAYTLDYVPPDQLEAVFPLIRDMLKGVVERSGGRWTLPSLITDLLQGRFDLLCMCSSTIKGIVGTHLHTTSSGMVILQIPFVTGEDSKDWLHLLGVIEDHARRNGASKVEMWARKGYARKLPDYHLSHVLLEKDLI